MDVRGEGSDRDAGEACGVGPAVGGADGPASVHVSLVDGWLALRFVGRFTTADLDAVRSIPGRRWRPKDVVWVLPHAPESLERLARIFGDRLVWSESLAAEAGRVRSEPAKEDAPPVSRPTFHGGVREILDAMRRALRTREYSAKTERAYLAWARRFLRFHARGGAGGGAAGAPRSGPDDRPGYRSRGGPADDARGGSGGGAVGAPGGLDGLDASHATAFLEHLAMGQGLAPRTRNQAASALAFMFREVFGRDEMGDVARARGPERVPAVLSHREVLRVLGQLRGKYFLVVVLLYSAGFRLDEALRLRVKDVDFELRQILVRDGKGQKDRYVPLARRAAGLLRAQIARVADVHRADRAAGHGWAPLPGAMHRKDPLAGFELGWQFVFPASTVNTDPLTGRTGRWPLHVTAVQRAVKQGVRRSGITKRASCHTFRHSFATEALRAGCDIRTLQAVLGHKDVRTTMIYLHVIEQTGLYIRSPLDRPDDPEDAEDDPIGRPWNAGGTDWELAARQWGGAGKARKRRKRRNTAGKGETDREAGAAAAADGPDPSDGTRGEDRSGGAGRPVDRDGADGPRGPDSADGPGSPRAPGLS